MPRNLRLQRWALQFAALALWLSPVAGWASRLDSIIPVGQSVHVYSRVLDEERRVFVSLPESYEKAAWSYPVVYVLDAESQFVHAAALIRYLARNDRIPESIVIGVTNTRRERDLTPGGPYHRSTGDALAGKADAFLSFLTTELRPWIATRYRTEDFSMLVGHSDGGLFALNTIRTRPESFQAYFAFSPSHGADMVADIAAGVRRLSSRQFLFLSSADHEPRIRPATDKLVRELRAMPHPETRWDYRFFDGENHRSATHPALYAGLVGLFSGFFPDDLMQPNEISAGLGPAALSRHYAALSSKLGVALRVPEGAYANSTRYFSDHNQSPQLLEIARVRVREYPFSAEAHVRLAEALESAGLWREALLEYEESAQWVGKTENPYFGLRDLQEKILQLREMSR